MRAWSKVLFLSLLVVVATGCESRTDEVDGGGVLLSVSDFDGLPIAASVNQAAQVGFVQVGEITITNVIKDPLGDGSNLMNVEIQSYEVVYTRADQGTRLPPKMVRGLFGVAPAGGDFTVENLPVMALEQLNNPPLSDLLFQNGGFDKETGSTTIKLNFIMRFFGRTLSGDGVETDPISFTVDFTP